MGTRTGDSLGRVIALALLCLILFSLPGCAVAESLSGGSDIYCLDEPSATYGEVIAQALPDYSVGWATRVYTALQQKNTTAIEASDPQALPALEHNAAGYWYPQYIATVIIAVDRDRTDADVRGWRELAVVKEEVGITGAGMNELLLSAIAYGTEGEAYTLTGAANLLSGLRKNGLLRADSYEPPIVICYDYLAAAMIKGGRNLEIIVPREGTFSYERGLLSNAELSFSEDIDSLLVSAGFRLTDGRHDETLYPAAAAYETAVRISDYEHFNTVCLDGDRVFRRNVLNTRLYSSADGREHQLFPLIYMIILIAWTASVFRRAMQKSVRRSAFVTGIILLCWMTVRLIKFQIADESVLGLYLWYSYYLFQLALPPIALWLAHTIDRPDNNRIPKWIVTFATLNAALIILVFTNHFHGFVFQIDFSKLKWAKDYGYGLGYTIIQFVNYSLMGLAFVMMIIKCGRSSRKKSLVFPLAFIFVLFLYGYGYFAKIPIALDSDFAMITALLTLLFFESALRTGLIPINKKYTAFFTNTTLGIQITDIDGKAVLASVSASPHNPDVLAAALASSPLPLPLDENTLLFANGIRGGDVFWQEDVTGLNLLHAAVDESVSKLTAANAMLAEEEKIKRIIAEENEKELVMARLEAEIAGYTAKLSAMAQQLENESDRHKKAAGIAILLCYVKRRCNLFFREQETHIMPSGELTGYLDELAGIAAYSGTRIVVSSDVNTGLSVRRAALFYDFFHSVIEWAGLQSRPHVMVHFREGGGRVILRLLPYASPKSFAPGDELTKAIASNGGKIAMENLDDAAAISLSFPQGGDGVG